VAFDGSGIKALEGAALGATLAAALGATLATTDGVTLAGGCVGAVVALPEQAERVMARTAIAAAAVRDERMQELLHETLDGSHTGVVAG
jgi:hypothetical protein